MKIYSVIQNVIIASASILVIFFVILFMIFNIRPAVVISGSMEPEIMTGSMAFVDYDITEPQVGDIIEYEYKDIKVIHRVASVEEDGYVTKGDNNKAEDIGIVADSQINGKYIFSIPYAGYVLMFFRTAKGITITVTAVVIFLLVGVLLKGKGRYD